VRMIGFRDYPVGPGRIVLFHTRRVEQGAAVPHNSSPVSYNEEVRLTEAVAQREAGTHASRWSVSSFESPESLDVNALVFAIEEFVRRHRSLRSEFLLRDGVVHRIILGDNEVSVTPIDAGHFPAGSDVLRYLEKVFDERADPLRWPGYVFAAISAETSTTVLMAFDHIHVDLQSHAIAVHEVESLYAAHCGREHANFPPPGNIIESYAAERRFDRDATDLDEALEYWTRMVSDGGGALPGFPVDLGLSPKTRLPLRSEESLLLDADRAGIFDQWCRQNGGTFFSGLLAAAGVAAFRITGKTAFRTIIPMRTRRDTRGPAVGWLVNGVPIEFDAGSRGLAPVMIDAQAACVAARRHGHVPFERILQLLPATIRREGATWFSYLDFTLFPGAAEHHSRSAAILTCPGAGAGADIWVNRTHTGVNIHLRYPDATAVRTAIGEYARTITDVIIAAVERGPAV